MNGRASNLLRNTDSVWATCTAIAARGGSVDGVYGNSIVMKTLPPLIKVLGILRVPTIVDGLHL